MGPCQLHAHTWPSFPGEGTGCQAVLPPLEGEVRLGEACNLSWPMLVLEGVEGRAQASASWDLGLSPVGVGAFGEGLGVS